MFVILVQNEFKKDLLYDGRDVWSTTDLHEAELFIAVKRRMNSLATFTLCQVTPMPQEAP